MQSITQIMPHKKIHFIGIGGVGMSALAQILLAKGYQVSGSDLKETPITSRLVNLGAKIFFGHKAENISEVDIVVYSSAIPENNPEVLRAKEKNINLMRRAELLASLMKGKTGIAIAGAHGKTTTTALIAYLLKSSGSDPSFAVGADVSVLGGNAQDGGGDYFVAEADESDGSFLYLNPEHAVLTNIDKEHLDYYENMQHIIDTYAQFVKNLSPRGMLCCYGEDVNIIRALEQYEGKIIRYGFNAQCDLSAFDIHCTGMSSTFNCRYKGNDLGAFNLQIPGEHNVLNALACIGIGITLGIDISIIKQALADFHGVYRRFQIRHSSGQITIIDDYAHHPTEIEATLKAAKAYTDRRIVGVFQPHRYSRTKFLKEEFGRCFALADYVVVTDIYAASEDPIEGVAAKVIYEQIKKNGHRDVHLLPKEKVNEHLAEIAQEGDVLMMLGAGDINTLADDLIKKLSAKHMCCLK
ncbi:MAG: UDP-N-acetylmuramate--L-alanine ligase [Candidatus Omnitrophota bacterium]